MDWQALISDLKAAGLSQSQIAGECETSQPTISDLANGNTKNPSWKVGEALRRLHLEKAANARHFNVGAPVVHTGLGDIPQGQRKGD